MIRPDTGILQICSDGSMNVLNKSNESDAARDTFHPFSGGPVRAIAYDSKHRYFVQFAKGLWASQSRRKFFKNPCATGDVTIAALGHHEAYFKFERGTHRYKDLPPNLHQKFIDRVPGHVREVIFVIMKE